MIINMIFDHPPSRKKKNNFFGKFKKKKKKKKKKPTLKRGAYHLHLVIVFFLSPCLHYETQQTYS